MRYKLSGLLLLVALFAVACGGQTPEEVAPTLEAVVEEVAPTAAAMATEAAGPSAGPAMELGSPDPLAVSGDVVTAGSSTVFPLTERMVERYENEGFSGQITVDSIGSGGGFERFCVAGETDVANASRPIKEEEVASCEAIGRTPIEFRVGTDALAVVVNPANDFVTDLTLEQLAIAFSSGETWADVDPSFPDEPIARYSPGTDSGTFDYFVEMIFDQDTEPILSAANTQFSEDDNVLVQGVTGDPYAIGYFGYAYYIENAERMKAVGIDNGNGCVLPNDQTVAGGTYTPLSRPLMIYVNSAKLAQPHVAEFVRFYLESSAELVPQVGYVALDANRYEQELAKLPQTTGVAQP